MTQQQKWQQRSFNKELEDALLNYGIAPLLSRLLAQRNIDLATYQALFSKDSVDNFNLTNHKNLENINELSQFMVDFIKGKTDESTVAVIGDYDVDGIVSAYILKKFFNVMKIPCYEFIPSRFEHGYGLTSKIIDSVVDEFKNVISQNANGKMPDVLFVVDSGSSSEQQIASLKRLGVKHIVVIDHHLIEDDSFSKSADYVLNWRMGGKAQEMCAAGLVYTLLRNIEQNFFDDSSSFNFDSQDFLPFAALATVADVSPVWGDNRMIVKRGLMSFKECNSQGLKELLLSKTKKCDVIAQEDVSFKIAPVLNAAGRMGSPQIAFDLLYGSNGVSPQDLAEHVQAKNVERQCEEKSIVEQAKNMVQEDVMPFGIFLINEAWNIGVVGIVASRLVELYSRPVVIVGGEGGVLKGSGRSVNGVHLKDVLDRCSQMFDGYGGHEMAAGLSLNRAFVDDAANLFNIACREYLDVNGKKLDAICYYDAHIKATTVSLNTWQNLQTLYPFCDTNNPEPVFLLKGLTVTRHDVKETDRYVMSKFFTKEVEYKAFTSFRRDLDGCFQGKKVNIYFKFSQNIHPEYGFNLNLLDIELVKD